MSIIDPHRDRIETMLNDGCSYREIGRTIGISHRTIRDAYPGRGWTYRQAGQFRAATRTHHTGCNTPGCHRKHKAKGLCHHHYDAARSQAQKARTT